MVAVDFNEATKKVSFDDASLQALSPEDRKQAESAAELVNRLMSELVNVQGDVPPPPNVLSKTMTVSASKLANNGVKELQQGKPAEAVKLLSTALEIVLRRPLWESTLTVLEETSLVLGPRCDAYVALEQWADAYADASLLLLIKPQEPVNYYRKGVILLSAGRVEDGRELLVTASTMAPNNPVIRKALADLDKKSGTDSETSK